MKYIYIILIIILTSCADRSIIMHGPQIIIEKNDTSRPFHIFPYRKRNMSIEEINKINDRKIGNGHIKEARKIKRHRSSSVSSSETYY